jgi:hypothetical protein
MDSAPSKLSWNARRGVEIPSRMAAAAGGLRQCTGRHAFAKLFLNVRERLSSVLLLRLTTRSTGFVRGQRRGKNPTGKRPHGILASWTPWPGGFHPGGAANTKLFDENSIMSVRDPLPPGDLYLTRARAAGPDPEEDCAMVALYGRGCGARGRGRHLDTVDFLTGSGGGPDEA